MGNYAGVAWKDDPAGTDTTAPDLNAANLEIMDGGIVAAHTEINALGGTYYTKTEANGLFLPSSSKGAAGGVGTLDANGKQPLSEVNAAVLGGARRQGTWDASLGTPPAGGAGLGDNGTDRGKYWEVSVAGTTLLGGKNDWQPGDWIVWEGLDWGWVDNTDRVGSVNGRTGAVAGLAEASQLPGAATETAPGLAEQATQAEVDGGSAGNLFVRPATHAAAHATPAKAAADPPGAYPTGISAFYLAAGTTGYPAAEGTVETHKVSAAQVLQFHRPRAGGSAPQVRYWDASLASGAAWTAWASLEGAGGGATFAGRLPFAYPIGGGPDTVTTTNLAVAINGGAIAVPVAVDAPLHLQSVSFWDLATANARGPVELAVYREPDAGSAVGDLVPNAVGTLAGYTPTAASARTVPVASPPVLLAPGLYWVCLKNNNTANPLALGGAAPGTLAAPAAQTKTLTTAAFGATLDLATGWAKINNVPGVRLNGRVLGQTAAF